MPVILNRNQSRLVDELAVRHFRISSLVLMENAARGLADAITRLTSPRGRTIFICGRGNNGGDGFAAARQLLLRDRTPEILLMPGQAELASDAAANHCVAEQTGIPVAPADPTNCSRLMSLTPADCLVDCLLGTGPTAAVRQDYARLIHLMNRTKALVISADIPSGLDCDTGLPLGCAVKAEHTVTFGTWKSGFQTEASQAYTGDISVADIGVPLQPLIAIMNSEQFD